VVKAVFDTNILIDFLHGRPEAGRELEHYDDRAISILTWMEVMVGATPETNIATRAFLTGFEVIPLDGPIAEAAVELRRRHRMKLPDAIVWASARRDGRLLVTRDCKDFPSDDPGVRMPYSL
jgi:predicted nucleic acid-binding protein